MTDLILVTGATGNIGKEVVNQLAARGARVRALVHSRQKAASIHRPGVEIGYGDLSCPETIAAALAGAGKLFLLSPMDPRLAEWERQTMEAARQAGVQQIVYLSGRNAHPESPLLFNQLHGQSERYLKQSKFDYTIIRPDALMQNIFAQARAIATRSTMYMPSAAAKVAIVDSRDIAAVVVTSLLEEGHAEKVYDVTGPEALSAYQMAETLSACLGKEVRCIEPSIDQYRRGLEAAGMPGWLVNYLVDLVNGSGAAPETGVTRVVIEVTRRQPISFEQFVRDFAAVFK